MSRPKIVNERNLRKAIEGSYGNITVIRKRLGCTRQTVWKAMKEFDVSEQLEQERETLLDSAEYVVAEAIVKRKDVRTSMWVLEKKGRVRGYNPELTTPADERTDNTSNVVFVEKSRKEIEKEQNAEQVKEAE